MNKSKHHCYDTPHINCKCRKTQGLIKKCNTQEKLTFCSLRWICFNCTYFHLVCEPPSGPDLAPCLDLRQTWEKYKQWNNFQDHEGKHNNECTAIFQMLWRLFKASLFPAKCNKTMEPKHSVLFSDLGVQGHLWSAGSDYVTNCGLRSFGCSVCISGRLVKPLSNFSQLEVCLVIAGGPSSV